MNCAFRRFKVLVKVSEISNTLILLLLGLKKSLKSLIVVER